MKKFFVKHNAFLFITAVIWGFAFVAQRVGMDFVGPFTFNGVRFTLGFISLVPVIMFFGGKEHTLIKKKSISVIKAGIISGIFLFLASSFQQVGLQGTTAGKAAFITGLYIVIVPVFSIFLGRHIDINSLAGALVAVVGLYILCVKTNMSISYSDLMELASAFLFAVQILLIDYFANVVDPIKLAFYEFATCALLSMLVAVFAETIIWNNIVQAYVPILYGGIMSIGVAYTFQILGQRGADPTYSSIIMSMETVFAAIGGFILLGEHMVASDILGCILMFIGIFISQFKLKKN